MANRIHPARTAVALAMFSVVVCTPRAHAQRESEAAGRPDAALFTLTVSPGSEGTPAGAEGTIRLAMPVTPIEGVQVAPAERLSDVVRPGAPRVEASFISGLEGPLVAWTARAPGPAAFAATLSLADARAPIPFDDRAARAVHWPIQGWPENTSAFLRPDAHADELNADLRRLVEGWLGAQTRSVTPAVLAKYLAARTMSHARPALEPLVLRDDVTGDILGLRSRGVSAFARGGAGSEFDMLRAYAAALRIAGIPARLVVGARVPRTAHDSAASLHAWVEFSLYDERTRDERWIPVDLAAQRWLAAAPPPVADAWRRFGDNDAALIPLAIGVPPASAKDPALLTPWRVECDPPCAPLRVTLRAAVAADSRGLAQR